MVVVRFIVHHGKLGCKIVFIQVVIVVEALSKGVVAHIHFIHKLLHVVLQIIHFVDRYHIALHFLSSSTHSLNCMRCRSSRFNLESHILHRHLLRYRLVSSFFVLPLLLQDFHGAALQLLLGGQTFGLLHLALVGNQIAIELADLGVKVLDLG